MEQYNFNIMKKITLTSFVTLSIITLFYISCTKEADTNVESEQLSFKESFINNQTTSEQKVSFKQLSDVDKTTLWKEKLNHLKKSNLPNEHLLLINNLLSELKSNGYIQNQHNPKVLEITKRLFKITPAEDLKRMFFCLDDYKYLGQFDTSSRYLSFDDSNLQKNSKSVVTSKSAGKEPCTCRWTCSSLGHSDCTTTTTGCGLLWLWSCNRRLF